ncbi:MAG: heavy-metal-associated domain-containing protein [Clostridia bacterium]|jgi:copper chaperone CopZ|nr:heavy-metal-associated domain-containing protein [Clostridia bacterium]
MKEIQINVKGMVCGGCEKRVVNSLNEIEGIEEVIASHTEGTVIIKTNKEIEIDIIKEKIEDIGFEVEEN